MAKVNYKIPETLDKNQLETLVDLKADDGFGLKPVYLYILLCWVGAFFLGFYAIMRSFIKSGGVFGIIAFIISYGVFCVNLFKRDSSGLMQTSLVATIPDYVPKSKKRINTRDITKNVYDFYMLVGIEDIDMDNGIIYFLDGSVGTMYRVVGNASNFLFDQDRDSILDRFRVFYNNFHSTTETIYITAKEPQQIASQVGNVYNRYQNLKIDDKDLKGLLDAQFKCLKEEIGGSYRSIHQYMILKSETNEDLTMAINILRREVESSTLVFRQCEALNGYEICETLSHVFSNEGGLDE